MLDTMLLVYINDNGATVHQLEIKDDPQEKYKELVEKHKDDPYETTSVLIWWNDEWVAERIWNPDFDEIAMDFEEKNLGHPGHPHEYGDS